MDSVKTILFFKIINSLNKKKRKFCLNWHLITLIKFRMYQLADVRSGYTIRLV